MDTRSGIGKSVFVRAFDIMFASTALAALALPLAILAALIKFDTKGPVFFRQARVGRQGRVFLIYKLRTMVHDDRIGSAIGDGRSVTGIGRALRATKLDELPQLINVLRGEMSLVGPRPEVPGFVELYSATDRDIVLSVAPGMTDFASIRFRREARLLDIHPDPKQFYIQTVMPAKLRYYRFYIARACLVLDISIIARTISALLSDLSAVCVASIPQSKKRGLLEESSRSRAVHSR